MTDAFANVVSPVFQQVIDLQERVRRGENPALEPQRQQIRAVLDEAQNRATAMTQLAHDFELARYALVYWIDEVLIASSWSHAMEWKQQILEWEIFGERLRADRFYEQAQAAERLANIDPLEVFFLCVALGFRGKYVDNHAELQQWSDRVYARIVAGTTQPEKFTPDEPLDREPLTPLPGKAILLGVSVLVSVTALVTLLCFILAIPPWG
ncbi:MAG TPA: DotU family type IV/VI secretion system protein [Isosphaeraceae bacterium]|jgi:type VI secretion system protein ImpK